MAGILGATPKQKNFLSRSIRLATTLSLKLIMDDSSRLMQWRMRLADLRGRGVYAGYPNRHRCIFVHIPKTAGSSVVLSLFGEGSRHVPYHEYERANPRKFRRYFKFAFVRNPWDRLVSSYFYLRNGGSGGHDQVWSGRCLAGYTDFGSFVRGWLTKESIWSWVHFKPQHYFICDANLRVRMDFVARLETIDTDFRYICERLNIAAELKQTNPSNHRHYSEYYTDELRERVAAVYADDIAIFGYEFNSPVSSLKLLQQNRSTAGMAGTPSTKPPCAVP